MKKAGIAIIVLVIIAAIILNGYIIIDNTQDVEEDFLVDYLEETEVFCEVEDIFKCEVVNYSLENDDVEISLTNNGKEDYYVKSFEINECDNFQVTSINVILNKSNNFKFKCQLGENEVFMEEIEIRYKRVYGPGKTEILNGFLVQREKKMGVK